MCTLSRHLELTTLILYPLPHASQQSVSHCYASFKILKQLRLVNNWKIINGYFGPNRGMWLIKISCNWKNFVLLLCSRHEKFDCRKRMSCINAFYLHSCVADNVSLSLCVMFVYVCMQHGITCIGFRDTQEKDRFLHQIDRLVRLQQDRSMKLRDRAASEATNKKKATELVRVS